MNVRTVRLVTNDSLKQEIEKLSDDQRQQVAEFIAFLRFKEKYRRAELDLAVLASLATEFAEEDRTLSEEGLDDYVAMLDKEDESNANEADG